MAIERISEAELPACLHVFHCGYETVAIEFGLTEENSPDRGRASLPLEKLVQAFETGTSMFGYYIGETIIGFISLRRTDTDTCKIDDLIVLPEYRGKGYGKELLDFSKREARKLGVKRIRLGMIDENRRLKNWYESNGFISVELIQYPGAPYTVGRMECVLA